MLVCFLASSYEMTDVINIYFTKYEATSSKKKEKFTTYWGVKNVLVRNIHKETNKKKKFDIMF